jgi:hypothetical protein
MLCNRPPPSIIAAHTRATATTIQPFLTHASSDNQALGLQPPKDLPARSGVTLKKSRHNDITWNHHKWLKEEQLRKAAEVHAGYNAAVAGDEKRRRFEAKAQALRDMIRGTAAPSTTTAAATTANTSMEGDVAASKTFKAFQNVVGEGAAPAALSS